MKDGIPGIYWVYRWSWSALHIGLVILALVLLLVWAFTDNQGVEAVTTWLRMIDHLRYILSNLIPFPWD